MVNKILGSAFLILVLLSGLVHGAIPAEEREALIALYNSTNGDNWTDNSGWKEPPLHTDGFAMPGTEGTWYGVTVSGGHVTKIDLNYNQITGIIPTELGNLSNLEYLILSFNQLSGSIPLELGNLSNLKHLDLYGNDLTNSIPPELGNLRNLEVLLLCSNQLSGSIPSELGKLSSLGSLYLFSNKLSGTIPKELGDLSNMRWLRLEYNQLSGSIPPKLGNLINLEYLYLFSNQLSGSIPSELGNLSNLLEMRLFSNKLSGSIPSELGNLTNLGDLRLSDNKLSSAIPTVLGNLTNLWSLRLNSNKLTGSIPSELENLSSLYFLYLSNNELSGTIPTSLMNLTKLGDLDIGYNCLYTNDSELKAWLDNLDPDWASHQDECTSISTYTLTVQSSPDTGVSIIVSPSDNNNKGNGSTQFFRTYDSGTIVNLTAPASHNGKNFVKWLNDGVESTNRTIQVTVNKNYTAQAVFQSPTYLLTVQSSPYSGVGITVSPTDNNGNGDGNTNFTRTYDSGSVVSLTAPSSVSGADFIKWTVDARDYSNRTIQLTMDSNHSAVTYYETSSPPEISVNRTSLNFGHIFGSSNIPKESFTIYNSGGETLNWTASCELWRVTLSPGSGTNYGVVEVTFDLDGLPPQKIKNDVIYVSDPLVANSPVEVKLNIWVKKQSESSPPFGEFATPIDGSIVRSSVPVTGWVLGDTGIENVKIYREEEKKLMYIGDAVLVEGARPDVEAAYPDYPMNYKAGWGYMMLTYFLPNGGNGVYKIHAIATDKEGRQTTLGVKTITCDNANAVKPFGAIDTPEQGGTASGSSFINWGWALTPQPNKIPTDGSTILGHPTYNNYRKDIANLFPGYSNSGGAAGYFYLDTTTYENGVHTIQWTATDDAGNTDGIGSRYFTIENIGTSSQQTLVTGKKSSTISHRLLGNKRLSAIPINYHEPVLIKKGYQPGAKINDIYPDENGIIKVEIMELERLEINLGCPNWMGFMVIGDQPGILPVGSTLNSEKGIFYWQPGPGFIGEYHFIFFVKGMNGPMKWKNIAVIIIPKFTTVQSKKGDKI
jgi:Leucine-rich repeat (LRR) protein